MPPASSGRRGFAVQPTSLDYAARLLEEIAGELGHVAGSFNGTFSAARVSAGQPDLERCLSLAALDFQEFAHATAAASSAEAHKLRAASVDYISTDQAAAAGLDLESIPSNAATAGGASLTEVGPR